MTRIFPLILLSAVCSWSATVNVTVGGDDNVYLSGMPNGTSCCGGDSAPGQSPTLVTGFSSGNILTFSVTPGGFFSNVGGGSGPTADGESGFGRGEENGISGYTGPLNALIGVFLDDSQPTSSLAPGTIDFSLAGATSFASMSPLLKQIFFIGDGLTGNGTGGIQQFIAPTGATRLFLGATDGFGMGQ